MNEENIQQQPLIIQGVTDYYSLKAFFLTQLALTLKMLNDEYAKIKVYGDDVKDEYFIKLLKNALVYTNYICTMYGVIFSGERKKIIEDIKQKIKDYLLNDLKDSKVISYKKAIEIWDFIIEAVAKLEAFIVPIETEKRESYPSLLE